jgi:hypothetical protein
MRLRAFLSRDGMLSEHMIDSSRELPSVRTYVERFGSMTRVYEMIGYDYSGHSEHILTHPKMRKIMWESCLRREMLRRSLLRDVCKLFRSEVKVIRKGPIDCPALCFSDDLRISVLICPSTRTPYRLPAMAITTTAWGTNSSHVVMSVQRNQRRFQEFYLVPSVGRLRYYVVKPHLRTLARLVSAKSTCGSECLPFAQSAKNESGGQESSARVGATQRCHQTARWNWQPSSQPSWLTDAAFTTGCCLAW